MATQLDIDRVLKYGKILDRPPQVGPDDVLVVLYYANLGRSDRGIALEMRDYTEAEKFRDAQGGSFSIAECLSMSRLEAEAATLKSGDTKRTRMYSRETVEALLAGKRK